MKRRLKRTVWDRQTPCVYAALFLTVVAIRPAHCAGEISVNVEFDPPPSKEWLIDSSNSIPGVKIIDARFPRFHIAADRPDDRLWAEFAIPFMQKGDGNIRYKLQLVVPHDQRGPFRVAIKIPDVSPDLLNYERIVRDSTEAINTKWVDQNLQRLLSLTGFEISNRLAGARSDLDKETFILAVRYFQTIGYAVQRPGQIEFISRDEIDRIFERIEPSSKKYSSLALPSGTDLESVKTLARNAKLGALNLLIQRKTSNPSCDKRTENLLLSTLTWLAIGTGVSVEERDDLRIDNIVSTLTFCLGRRKERKENVKERVRKLTQAYCALPTSRKTEALNKNITYLGERKSNGEADLCDNVNAQ
ncbi:MAG: hypothetical protein AB7O88_19795 [Reyranellaceae bacterium]